MLNDANLGSSIAVVNSGVAWASAPAVVNGAYQILGFSGSASLQACSVKVFVGNTLKWTGWAHSGHPYSEFWGSLGLVSSNNEEVAVKTQNVGTAGNSCTANLFYRIML